MTQEGYGGLTDLRRGHVWIPNKELHENWKSQVKLLYKSMMLELFSPDYCEEMVESLSAFDVIKIEVIMKDMVRYCAYQTVPNSENPYHLFFYGCFFNSINGQYGRSCRKTQGRLDILIEFGDDVVLFEFNKSKTIHSLDKDAEEALEQCKSNPCLVDLSCSSCLLIGISFCGDQMSGIKFELKKF